MIMEISTDFFLLFFFRTTGELIPYFLHMKVNDEIAPEMVLKLEKGHRLYVTGTLKTEPVYGTEGQQMLASTILVDDLIKRRITEQYSVSVDAGL